MSGRLWFVIAAGALFVGLLGGYLVADRANDRAREGRAETASTQEKRSILYWHDPMVPGTRFDKPGKSPFMDMQLVPVYADEEARGTVQIDSNVAQNLGIRLSKVEKRAVERRVRAVGSVVVDERRIQVVQTRTGGTVARLHVKAPLARVSRGQLLAEIVSPEWLGAQQEYVALLDAQSAPAQAIREAARQRLDVLGVPEAAVRHIEATRQVSAMTKIWAPMDGVVTELATREGAAFAAGSTLFQITDLRSVWVQAQIPEAQLAAVKDGATVQVSAQAWPGMTFQGHVIALLPSVDPQTRTIGVRVEMPNDDERLVPGMYVSVEFTHRGVSEQFVIPSEAVITTGERTVVIVAHERGGFDVADVVVGGEDGGLTTVVSGLHDGQSVVLSGQFLIDSEASLKSTINRMEDDREEAGPKRSADRTEAASTQTEHSASGEIVALTAEQITIAHGPVPTLDWPAMTMGFRRPTNRSDAALKVGDRVRFSFIKRADGAFQLERIAPMDQPERRR